MGIDPPQRKNLRPSDRAAVTADNGMDIPIEVGPRKKRAFFKPIVRKSFTLLVSQELTKADQYLSALTWLEELYGHFLNPQDVRICFRGTII